MKRSLLKDTVREIWKTRSRFLSIFLIVFLGCGFFAGVKATCPDMKDTAQKYYEDYALADLFFKSTLGFSQDDVEVLRQDGRVLKAEPGYTADAMAKGDGDSSLLVHLISYNTKNGALLNKPVLMEGRMPESPNECAVETDAHAPADFKIGKTIAFHGDADQDLSESLRVTEFTIVGVVRSPMYINFERGTSQIGDGSVDSYVIVPEEAFAYEVYTDVALQLKDARDVYSFDQEYDDLVADSKDAFKQLGEERSEIRLLDATKDARQTIADSEQKLADGRSEYDYNKQEFDSKIADAQRQLAEAETRLADGKKEYEDGLRQYEDGQKQWEEGAKQLETSRAALEENRAVLQEGRQQLESSKTLLQGITGVVALFEQQAAPDAAFLPLEVRTVIENASAFDENLSGLLTAYVTTDPASPAKQALKGQLAKAAAGVQGVLNQKEQELTAGEQQLAAGQTQYDAGKQELDGKAGELAAAKTRLEQAQKEIKSGEKELAENRVKLESQQRDGQQRLDDALRQLEDGERELADGKAELAKITASGWYVLDRSSNPGYSDFGMDAERVDKVAAVFPIFFILVAALVCLTTMSRMVEEQRSQMGTLKALGYGNGSTLLKYLFYAVTAALLGSVLGLVVGFWLFPTVIFNAYQILYIMPKVIATFRWDYALGCIGISVLGSAAVVVATCYQEFAHSPARLMQPKAPVQGKRVLLERVGFLWKRMGFLQKVTARNIFRYKKRVLMTVIGVAGCTALLLTSFGLRYAISSIVDKQYGNVFVYDLMAVVDAKADQGDLDDLNAAMKENSQITGYLPAMQKTTDFSANSRTESAYLFVPQDADALKQFVSLHNRQSGRETPLTGEGAVVTEKLAKKLKLSVGDLISVSLDNREEPLTVTGIAENYTFSYVYVSPGQYRALSGRDASYDTYLVNITEDCSRDSLSSSLVGHSALLGLSYSSEAGQKFIDMMASLNYIILVIILCAGLLAFVVLYNLTNINMHERIRELATIKVLGFYGKEVASYVYRENVICALMGVVCGLFLGVPLCRFVVQTAEVEMVMFAPDIDVWSFVYAVILSVVFIAAVNIALYGKLKKIDMVSSLKSVE